MKNNIFKNKKIGIWGFGIVGQSAQKYFQKHTNKIQIMDSKVHDVSNFIQQRDETITTFLNHNDYIIASPGIPLHDYQAYKDKFITELDIFAQEFRGNTVAITGTLGKTSITTLLAQHTPNALAGGNIGYAMLNILTKKPKTQTAILELSSFQLNHTRKFAPDIGIWSNFYPNHLDHHKSEDEYFTAKCNIIKHQTPDQTCLLPCNLLLKIKKTIPVNSQIFLFCSEHCTSHDYPTFTIKSSQIVLHNNKHETLIFKDTTTLPKSTFVTNWLIVIATLHLQKNPLASIVNQSKRPEHRLELIGTYKSSKFYNDSKSTVWQATKQAIESLDKQRCTLFLGGISKGTDREPLIKYLHDKPILVLAFGKEAQQIYKLCIKHKVFCHAFELLEEAFDACIKEHLAPYVLFSPAGASFDLFPNYAQRGKVFKKLFKSLF